MIVPHADERPARPRVLEIRVGEIAAVGGPVVVERGRQVESAHLPAGRVADEFAQAPSARLSAGAVFGIEDELVDEVAEVQYEAEALRRSPALILEDHLAPGVHGALGRVLAADEGEADRPLVAVRRRGQGPADPAALAFLVDEAEEIFVGRLQSAREEPAGPAGRRADARTAPRDNLPKVRAVADFDRQLRCGIAVDRRPPGPQDHAVGGRVSRRDSLRIEFPPLGPWRGAGARANTAMRRSHTQGRGGSDELATIEQGHRILPPRRYDYTCKR